MQIKSSIPIWSTVLHCDVYCNSACVQCMCIVHVYSACVLCMCTVHVYCACVQCMCTVHVYSTCVQCMCTVHVYCTCLSFSDLIEHAHVATSVMITFVLTITNSVFLPILTAIPSNVPTSPRQLSNYKPTGVIGHKIDHRSVEWVIIIIIIIIKLNTLQADWAIVCVHIHLYFTNCMTVHVTIIMCCTWGTVRFGMYMYMYMY